MNVGTICKRPAVTISSSDGVVRAAQLMRATHVGYLVVVETDAVEGMMHPVGVLTDRDIVMTVVAREVDPKTLRVEDIMSARPITTGEDEPIAAAIGKMRKFGIRRLPVVNRRDELVGVLSMDNVLGALATETQDIVSAIREEWLIEGTRRPGFK